MGSMSPEDRHRVETTALLKDVPLGIGRKVADAGTIQVFAPDATIFTAGEKPSFLHLILAGRIALIGEGAGETAVVEAFGEGEALLTPAVVAGALIVFASSMDDFVISAFLSTDASSVTVPIKLYSAVRTAPSPALNALATLLLLGSALALVLAWAVLRRRRGVAGAGRPGGSALKEMASIDV